MASWAARCFEQIRYSCAMAKNPITILGGGPALGYSPSGPAHCPVEDIAYMRSIAEIEIFSPANDNITERIVDLTCNKQKLRYIRLERSYPKILDSCYSNTVVDDILLNKGMCKIKKGVGKKVQDVCIVSSGYMLDRALEVADKLEKVGYMVSVLDLFKLFAFLC